MSSPPPKAPRCISIGCASGPNDFDPAVRDRLLAGAMVPAPLVDRAQKFRRWYRAQVLEMFKTVDVIIAPATPCVAPKLGQVTFMLDGVELPVRANIGIHTQPISFIGLPVVAVPIPLQPMPIGVQIIAAPWREDIALRVAHALERMGVAAAPPPRGFLEWKSIFPTCSPRSPRSSRATKRRWSIERRRRARRIVPRRSAHAALRHRRKSLWL